MDGLINQRVGILLQYTGNYHVVHFTYNFICQLYLSKVEREREREALYANTDVYFPKLLCHYPFITPMCSSFTSSMSLPTQYQWSFTL